MLITPILQCERCDIQDLLGRFRQRTASSNQHGSIYFDGGFVTMRLLERKKMFPKKVFLLQKFYKEENERQKSALNGEANCEH